MQITIILLFFVIASCVAQNWIQLPGAAIEISVKGKERWVINKSQQIFRWVGSNWQHIPGQAVKAGASPDGWTWVCNSADDIFRFNVNTNKWDHMPGKLMQISAMSKDRALGVNRANNIYLWENNAWKQLPGSATWAGMGDGDERWVVNAAQQIYRWNHSTNTWDHMPGAAVNVDVQNPCRIIVTNIYKKMYIWKNNTWQLLTGSGKRSSITSDSVYTVSDDEKIWWAKY